MKKFITLAIVAMAALLQGTQAFGQFNPYALSPKDAKAQSIEKGGQLVRSYDKIFLDGYHLNKADIQKVMTPDNYATWRSGKSAYDIGGAISMAGLVGVIVGVAGIASDYITQPNDSKLINTSSVIGGVGFGLIAVSIPVQIAGLKKMKRAVEAQNEGGVAYIGATPNGYGIAVRF